MLDNVYVVICQLIQNSVAKWGEFIVYQLQVDSIIYYKTHEQHFDANVSIFHVREGQDYDGSYSCYESGLNVCLETSGWVKALLC